MEWNSRPNLENRLNIKLTRIRFKSIKSNSIKYRINARKYNIIKKLAKSILLYNYLELR